LKRLLIILALAVTLGVPFWLRPRHAAPERADDTVVIVTPHNEEIRHEFEIGFRRWYEARTGRSILVDWRVLGGTSEITRFLEGAYVASFRNLWTGALGRPWSAAIQSGFQAGALPAGAPAPVREARAAFLASDVGCGIDVFFGGDTYSFGRQASAGRIVDSGLAGRHPEWFTAGTLPESWGGEQFREPRGLWLGCVVSSYGIIFNRDRLRGLGFADAPAAWSDLADPRLQGEVALCDPTKSTSIATAFENVIQQQISASLAALPPGGPAGGPGERRAVREGWLAGLRLIQRIGANARYFTDSSQKPPIDVSDGNCAAGMCIDFYGREQQESVRLRGSPERLGFVSPPGGTAYSVDPIALLRGARNRAAGAAFIEYVLSLDGQKLWNFRPGTPGGPRDFALRRLPVRRDFYSREAWLALRTDPAGNPYASGERFTYHPEWTAGLFREMAFVIRIMCQDTHEELARAWRAANAAPAARRTRALEVLEDLSAVDYDRTSGLVRGALESRNAAEEIRLARTLGDGFRRQYARAEALAAGRIP
jgi:ABC-type Fe3+ transport system substrate-binding protein